jgi:hypothetical protein
MKRAFAAALDLQTIADPAPGASAAETGTLRFVERVEAQSRSKEFAKITYNSNTYRFLSISSIRWLK